MCTSLKLKYKKRYVFGRNLDLEYHFNEGDYFKWIIFNEI